MTRFLMPAALLLLTACDIAPSFVTDAPIVRATSERPDHFTLPARFALVRTVYGQAALPSRGEAEIWEGVLEEASELGTFQPVSMSTSNRGGFTSNRGAMFDALRDQRFNYMLNVALNPQTGGTRITLFDVASGAVMASAVSTTDHGARGFWGRRVNNPSRLDRITSAMAQEAAPQVAALLDGVAARAQP